MFTTLYWSQVKILRYKYLFVFFSGPLSAHFPEVRKMYAQLSHYCATALGAEAAVVRSFEECDHASFDFMTRKRWPEAVQAMLDDGFPSLFVAVVETDLDDFQPDTDRYILLRYRAAHDEKDAINTVVEMQKVIAQGGDLFDWWQAKQSRSNGLIQRFGDAVQLKPGAFGISIDLKKLMKP